MRRKLVFLKRKRVITSISRVEKSTRRFSRKSESNSESLGLAKDFGVPARRAMSEERSVHRYMSTGAKSSNADGDTKDEQGG